MAWPAGGVDSPHEICDPPLIERAFGPNVGDVDAAYDEGYGDGQADGEYSDGYADGFADGGGGGGGPAPPTVGQLWPR